MIFVTDVTKKHLSSKVNAHNGDKATNLFIEYHPVSIYTDDDFDLLSFYQFDAIAFLNTWWCLVNLLTEGTLSGVDMS